MTYFLVNDQDDIYVLHIIIKPLFLELHGKE